MKGIGFKRLAVGLMVFAVIVPLGLVSCASAPQAASQSDIPGETSYPPYTGPKKRIAVSKFGASGAFLSVYGGWDIGGGLAAQLTTELINSGRFIVVERAALGEILREQEMALEKIVTKETASRVGRLLGAQFLIRGEVTEFEQQAGGGGGQIGITKFPLGGVLGLQTTTAHVGMDIRLIDTTSGQILQSHRVEAKARETGVAAEIDTKTVSFGGDTFYKTPLGKASREAIREGVLFIIRQMEAVSWTGRVADVIGGKVYINSGSSANIKVGDTFVVSTVLREVIDPETQQVLGVLEDKLGEIRVEAVQDRFSIATLLGDFTPKKGDLVRFK